MRKIKIPASALEAMLARDNNEGFCLSCGAEAYGVEPDAVNYRCESCGAQEVFGASEILIMEAYDAKR
jgi:predicted RNA-binding Zn-ribbon protein involved in translation (DUF1610 family)